MELDDTQAVLLVLATRAHWELPVLPHKRDQESEGRRSEGREEAAHILGLAWLGLGSAAVLLSGS